MFLNIFLIKYLKKNKNLMFNIMSNTYRLVNPYIDGEMKTSLKMNNSILAG